MCRVCACACERVRKPFPAISRHTLYPLYSWAPQLWLTLPTSAEKHFPTSGFSPLPLKKLVLKNHSSVLWYIRCGVWHSWKRWASAQSTQCSLKAFVDKSNRQRCSAIRSIWSNICSEIQAPACLLCCLYRQNEGRYLTALFGDAKLMLVSYHIGFSIIGPLLHHFNEPTIILDQWKAKRDHEKPAEFWPGGITWYSTVWVWRSNTRTAVPGERFTALIALSQMFITDVSSRIQGHPAATQVCSVCLGQTKISACRLEKK